MKRVHLLVVGKLKDKNLLELEQNYLKRIRSLEFSITELKARAQEPDQECQSLVDKINDLKKLGRSLVIALDELGQEKNSPDFSSYLFKQLENYEQIIFLIGGAQGLNSQIKTYVDETLALSKMTLPHKVARLFFIEQIYRAITIETGHPYHN